MQTPFDVFPQRRRNEATGAGFVIDGEGHVLTNSHVVQRATKIEVGFGEGKTAEAKLVGQDAGNDVALLKVETGEEEPRSRSSSATLRRSRSATRWSRSGTRSASTGP